MAHSQDPDDLWGDAPIARIEITTRRNGSMSVAGDIDNLPYALAMIDNARDAIKGHHARRRVPAIIPASDLELIK